MKYLQLIIGSLLLSLPFCRPGVGYWDIRTGAIAYKNILQATEDQMWAAGKLMRDVCLPKFPKITAEIADGIQKGNLPDDKDAKCYINCVMEMMQSVSSCCAAR